MGRGGFSFSLGCTSGTEIRGERQTGSGTWGYCACVDRGAETLDVAEIRTIYRQTMQRLLRETRDKGGWVLVT